MNKTIINVKTVDTWIYQFKGTNGNILDLNSIESYPADIDKSIFTNGNLLLYVTSFILQVYF